MPNVAAKPKTKPGKSTVQSLLLPKSRFNRAQAKAWAKSHGYKSATIEEGKTYWRIRQYNPGNFSKMRTMTLDAKSGVKAVIGVVKDDGGPLEAQ
jgi:hypothetical protein